MTDEHLRHPTADEDALRDRWATADPTNGFPMPGSSLCGRTVVASCYFCDYDPDDPTRPPSALVILLNESMPYFKVAEVEYQADPPKINADEDAVNIIDAVHTYAEWGGGI